MSALQWTTLVHAIIATLGLGTGLVATGRLVSHRPPGVLLRFFFAFASLTDATGFLFPYRDILPTHLAAIASLMVLGVTLRGYVVAHQHGAWRGIYRVGVITSTYLLALMATLQVFSQPGSTPAAIHAPRLFLATQGLLLAASLAACVQSLRARPGRRRRTTPPMEVHP
ncbi:hypothetical protein ABIE56_000282 [Luteibacter sp. 621]|uniref:hypothetical protein n=1 Tax=Luteibacter sp. 621 TaxID=3373916 RepID=UPI003D249349